MHSVVVLSGSWLLQPYSGRLNIPVVTLVSYLSISVVAVTANLNQYSST